VGTTRLGRLEDTVSPDKVPKPHQKANPHKIHNGPGQSLVRCGWAPQEMLWGMLRGVQHRS